LVLAGLLPKVGVAAHWIVLVAACCMDQFRLEPQFFGLAVLMLAYFDIGGDKVGGAVGLRFARWYLVAMWIWTGTHKLLSSEWMGHISWGMVDEAGLPADQLYLVFAIAVAATELTLGLLAWFRPDWAAWLCVAVHIGIAIFLSPLFTGMNYSVIPWNIGIACVGCWILLKTDSSDSGQNRRVEPWEKATFAVLMLIPLGFYPGWIDRCFSHVMYSGNLPSGLITTEDGSVPFDTYPELAVPFPHERRLFRQYFALTAKPGDKLHVADPRSRLPDQYFVMLSSDPRAISALEFYDVGVTEDELAADVFVGIGIDDRQSLFALSQAGVRMLKRTEQSMVYAVAFTPENFDRRLVSALKGLPNLQQIQFSGTEIRDSDLAELRTLRRLTGLGLDHTAVTDAGLGHLDDLPLLSYVESDGTTITKYKSE